MPLSPKDVRMIGGNRREELFSKIGEFVLKGRRI